MKTILIMPNRPKGEIAEAAAPYGWGEKYRQVTINGRLTELELRNDKDEALLSIRVKEDGDLIITNYGSSFSIDTGHQIRLQNTRPWK